MDLVSRLKQYLDSLQISVTQFADECGIPRPTASQLLAGRNKKVSDEIIGKIHQCYPELNVIWLMFGEGSMLTTENMQISEPENGNLFDIPTSQHSEIKEDILVDNPQNPVQEIQPEKFETTQTSHQNAYNPNRGDEFRFSTPAERAPSSTFVFGEHSHPTETAQTSSTPIHAPKKNSSPASIPITLTPEKGKRVIGIVVYYDDSTFESFVPDPDHSAPFIR